MSSGVKYLWVRRVQFLGVSTKQQAGAGHIYVGLSRTVHTYMCTVYDRMFGTIPAKNTVYTPYVYGSGQPYINTAYLLCTLSAVQAMQLIRESRTDTMYTHLIICSTSHAAGWCQIIDWHATERIWNTPHLPSQWSVQCGVPLSAGACCEIAQCPQQACVLSNKHRLRSTYKVTQGHTYKVAHFSSTSIGWTKQDAWDQTCAITPTRAILTVFTVLYQKYAVSYKKTVRTVLILPYCLTVWAQAAMGLGSKHAWTQSVVKFLAGVQLTFPNKPSVSG